MGRDIRDLLGEGTIARLHELIGDRTDAVVGVATPEAEMVWASAPGSAELFGRELADFERRSQYDFLHPDDHALFRRRLERARSGETVRYVVRARTADGSWLGMSCVAWAVTTNGEQLIVSLAVPADATGPSGGAAAD